MITAAFAPPVPYETRPAAMTTGSTEPHANDPSWARPALVVLLAGTGVLYIWGLSASGWSNSFYSAAVQAGTKSWKAFFFGSSDASNFITVDKPPASLWVMEISARLFGLSSWSILVPQALEGVAAVGLLHATVRRWFGARAGLVAAAVMATTPVAVLMFRFDNPDALLVLLLVASAYALTRALETGSTRWLVAAGALVGFGFLAKMLQAFVVVPGFAVTYLVAAPARLRRRFAQLVAAGAAMFVSAGWWVAVVEIVPASWRPYVGGSEDNSVLNLIFGYNGLGRVTGNETGSVGGRSVAGGSWGATGWSRMFDTSFGGQASWLIPAALVLGAVGLLLTARRPRTDRARAALLLWVSWLVVTGVLLSLSKGIIHPYYTVALTPAIGALVGIGGHLLWTRCAAAAWHGFVARTTLAATIVASSWWAVVLLRRSPVWHPWLRTVVVVGATMAALAVIAGHWLRARSTARIVAGLALVASLVSGLGGPVAFALQTASTPHTGSIPSAGPSASLGRIGLGGFATRIAAGRRPTDGGRSPTVGEVGSRSRSRSGGDGGGGGGLLSASIPTDEVVTLLDSDADEYRWVLATVGSNRASGYQLATGDPVMAIGGFNGTDPTPTLDAFQSDVAAGDIHYFLAGGTGGRNRSAAAITTWVRSNFAEVAVGGTTLYDLTRSVT